MSVSTSGKLPFDRNALPPGLTLSGGRPRTLKVLDATISRTASLGRGYKDEDMVILTDDSPDPRKQPTRANVLDAMHWLVRGARPHDSLFFHCAWLSVSAGSLYG